MKEIIKESKFQLIREKTNLDSCWKITYEDDKEIELSEIIENKKGLIMKNEKRIMKKMWIIIQEKSKQKFIK